MNSGGALCMVFTLFAKSIGNLTEGMGRYREKELRTDAGVPWAAGSCR